MTPAALEALRRLADARKSADLAALEGLLRARRACAAEILALDAARAAECAAPPGKTPPEARAARLLWTERRGDALRRRREALDREIAVARRTAAASLGREQALGQLRDRALREAARARATRQERDAPPPEERRYPFD